MGKTKKEVIGIVFSDTHIDDPNKFNKDGKRTLSTLRVLHLIKKQCLKYGCPAIMAGDLFNKPEVISNNLFSMVVDSFIELDKDDWTMFAISGNHDNSGVSKIDQPSKSWVNSFGKIFKFLTPIDFTNGLGMVNGEPRFKIFGVPYIDHNIGLREYVKNQELDNHLPNILVLHSNYPGAKDTNGIEVREDTSAININMFQKFDLTIMGHIHKPQRLGKKIYMSGAPIQQRRTDKDCKMGYWKLYSDMTLKFKEITKWPKFIDVETEEEILDDGNYYTVLSKKVETSKVTTNNITRDISRKTMVNKYFRAKSIKDKVKKQRLTKVLNEVE